MAITPKVGDGSPWGTVTSVEPLKCARRGCEGQALDKGARWISTASHGGIWVPDDLAPSIPDVVVEASFLKDPHYWEEDCDAAWPIHLLKLGCAHDQEHARSWLERNRPELLKETEGLKEPEPQEGIACPKCGSAEDIHYVEWVWVRRRLSEVADGVATFYGAIADTDLESPKDDALFCGSCCVEFQTALKVDFV